MIEKAILCGDLHGKVEVYKDLRENTTLPLILMGDFCDAFDRTTEQIVDLIVMVLRDAKEGRTRFLMGNHELSYLEPDLHRCAGYRADLDMHMMFLGEGLAEFSEPMIQLGDDVIATHAGITWPYFQILDDGCQFGTAVSSKRWDICLQQMQNRTSEWHQIGKARGGIAPWGGPLWCDWNDEFVPVAGIRQIVGHTAGLAKKTALGIPRNFKEEMHGQLRRSENGDWNIDCLDRAAQFLLFDNGSLSPFDI